MYLRKIDFYTSILSGDILDKLTVALLVTNVPDYLRSAFTTAGRTIKSYASKIQLNLFYSIYAYVHQVSFC